MYTYVYITASVDCTIRVWRAADGSCVRVLGERSRAKVWCCAFDCSGLLLASGGSDNVVRVSVVRVSVVRVSVVRVWYVCADYLMALYSAVRVANM